MTTTPPTAAEIDANVSASDGSGDFNFALLLADPESSAYASTSNYSLTTDMVAWVVAYTDNAGHQHFEGLGIAPAGAIGATDAELEAASPPMTSGSLPLSWYGSEAPANTGTALLYLQSLVAAYGAITLRGYLLPAIAPWPPAPVDDTVQAWVNDTSNWPTTAG